MNGELKFFAKLLVLDLKASGAFYEALGFTRVGTDGTFLHLRWEEQGDVLLVSVPPGVRAEGKRGWGVLLGFTTKTDVAELAARAAKLNAPVNEADTPWYTKELVVTDPDGYRLNFVQPAA